jgi:hypothetical protein
MKTIRRSERGGALQVVLIVLGVIVLIVALVVLAAVVMVKRFVKIEVDRDGGEKRVAVHTPFGEFTAEKSEDAVKKLKLPVYPGAEPDEEAVSLKLWGRVKDEEGGLNMVAASFRSRDSFDQVDAWYRRQLGTDFIRETGRITGGERKNGGEWQIRVEPGGSDVLYKFERQGRVRAVGLSREFSWVKIGLFELVEARPQ